MRLSRFAALPALLLVGAGLSPRTSSETIQVHGSWSIVVRNPDGTVAARRDFENALMSDGRLVLAGVLARQTSVGLWEVYVSGTSLCGPANTCLIVDPSNPSDSSNVRKTLQVSLDSTGSKLVLVGTLTADATTSVDYVQTRLNVCPPEVSPAECRPGKFVRTPSFTGTPVTPPLPVVPDQKLTVTVKISFS